MGLKWYQEISPEPEKNSFGEYTKKIGEHYLDTQRDTGTGEWKPDLIPTSWYQPLNKLAKKELEKQIKEQNRGIEVSELLNWLSPTRGRVANDAAAKRMNDINILSKGDRLTVGDYAVGAWNLIPDYDESQTRGLPKYRRTHPVDDGSRYYTGETPTYKDIKPTNIWHLDPEWQRED